MRRTQVNLGLRPGVRRVLPRLGVASPSVGFALQQRRPLAIPGPPDGLLGGLVDGQDVGAVYVTATPDGWPGTMSRWTEKLGGMIPANVRARVWAKYGGPEQAAKHRCNSRKKSI